MENYGYLDLEGGLARVRGSKKLYRKMLTMFLGSGEFASFEEAIGQGDLGRAGDVAHAIKGMTGNLSFMPLFEASGELCEQLKKGQCDDATIGHYRDTLAKTREEVEALAREMDAQG